MSSLKQKAIRGSIWLVFGFGSSQCLRLISNLILTRLLVPELFGLMALVNTFIMGLELFSDVGIKPSIVRSERGEEPIFLNTAWTLQVIRGCGLWICSLIIAFPLAQFYNEPKLTWLIPIVGLSSLISGFQATSLALLNRHIETGKLTIINVTTQILSLTAMIVWAYFHRSIWALIIGTFVSQIVKMYWSHSISSIKHHFTWNKEVVRELISFGRWIFISTAMSFLAAQGDRLILGKLLSLEKLGICTVAFTFSSIPVRLLMSLNSSVIFPLISQNKHLSRQTLRNKILKKRIYIISALGFLITILFATGDFMVSFLYDPRYHSAGWMLSILALGIWPITLHATINPVLLTIGKPFYVAFGNFLKVLYILIVVPLGYSLMGVFGVIIAVATNDIMPYIVINYGLSREGFSCLKQDFQATMLLLLVVILVVFTRHYLGLSWSIDATLN